MFDEIIAKAYQPVLVCHQQRPHLAALNSVEDVQESFALEVHAAADFLAACHKGVSGNALHHQSRQRLRVRSGMFRWAATSAPAGRVWARGVAASTTVSAR